MSPFCRWTARSRRVASTTAAGTINHTARGGCNLAAKSSSDAAPTAPSLANCLTFSRFMSKTTHVCPSRMMRRTMLAPIRPRPIIPNSIASPPSTPVSRTKLLFSCRPKNQPHCCCHNSNRIEPKLLTLSRPGSVRVSNGAPASSRLWAAKMAALRSNSDATPARTRSHYRNGPGGGRMTSAGRRSGGSNVHRA